MQVVVVIVEKQAKDKIIKQNERRQLPPLKLTNQKWSLLFVLIQHSKIISGFIH